ncbi:MAG: YihA family ribosome biogenesis GTP-binding protein, partial [Parasporobacterium sp.]|nr:YihA family ribosome biogenesis GTP-binding protein [Parasporobacterium sp.]
AQAKWGQLIEKYLNTSKTLKTVFLLVDVRHEAKSHDKQMYQWILEKNLKPIVIATKADKLSKNELNKQLRVLRKGLELTDETQMIPFSAVTKAGKDEIWNIIDALVKE